MRARSLAPRGLDARSMLVLNLAMGRFLWAWCLAALLLVGFAASARAQEGMIVAVCVRPKEIPEDIARNGWAFAPDAVTVVRMPRKDFKEASRGKLVYHFDPAAPPENTKLLPIRYHHLKCDPYQPPPSPPPAPSATPTAGPPQPPPPPHPVAGGTGGAASKPAKDKPAKDKPAAEEEAPFSPPQPIVYRKEDQEPKPRPPSGGVTAHWPSTVLPITRRPVDTQTKVLPVATVLPVTQPKVDTQTKVLPAARVLPNKYDVGKPGKGGEGGGEGDGSTGGKAPNKVAKKTTFEKITEQVAIAGAIANTQMNADLNRPDGKRFGIVGGTNANGPNNPVAQASAGTVLVAAAVLSAGASKLVKKLETALAKKAPLLYPEMAKVGEDVAEELVTKLGPKLGAEEVRAGLAQALNENGAIGPYSVMRKFTDKLGGKYQAHHILEVKFAKRFGLGNTDKIPSVILTDAEHKALTAELAAKTRNAKTREELWTAYQEVYERYPHWLEAIKSYFVKGA